MAKQTYTAGQVLTAAQMTTLQTNDYNQTVSTKTVSYILVAADAGTKIVMNSASATTITVNTSLFTAGDTLTILNIGAGVCTITAGTATVSTAGTLALVQNAGGTLYFTSAGVSVFQADGVSSGALTFIKSQVVGSVVASVAVTNAFSATYDNYKIIYSGGVSAATQALKFSLTGMGNVAYGGFFGTTVGGAANNSGANGISFMPIAGYVTVGLTLLNAEISMPFASMATLCSFMGARDALQGFGMSFYEVADTTSYTGFTLLPSSCTMQAT